ncbi:MAG: polysaccharide biosynthesis protein, partial [Acidobacteriota bacterium]|nr:polysaccharide biosynthesis protein [Acidobacteriota bacterium]
MKPLRLLISIRRPLIALLHVGLFALAWTGSFALRFDYDIPEPFLSRMLTTLPIVLLVKLGVFAFFGLLHGWWKFVGLSDLITIARAALVATVAVAITTVMASGFVGIPRSVFPVDLVLTFLFVGGVRFAVRVFAESLSPRAGRGASKRVLVVGAGRTGSTLVREMRANPSLPYEPVGFVDDDPHKEGLKLHGVSVLGTTREISELVRDLEVEEVLLAIPSATGRQVRRVIDNCREGRVAFKTMPSVGDLIDGRISMTRIREVRIEDLLGREPTELDLGPVRANTEGHVVLVTGAAGSIGSELSRQIASLAPAHLLLLDRSESDLHDLELMLRHTLPNVKATAVVCDILDADDLESVFAEHRPSRVYHAAAYKHVGLMERHVVAAVRNNVVGTYRVATLAVRYGADQFVLVSTDKAVRPTSLMGATKRAAERVVSSFRDGRTRFTAVRFGNVLGSRGSVVPIFKRQIEMGGPVTVTHADVVRYFMTIPEAVQLVLQASVSAASRGGDIFHLDMGEPVRIADLAANMIRLSGFEPGIDIDITYVGLRAGEKLSEELLTDGDEVAPTEHPRVRVVRAADPSLRAGWV